MEVLITSSVVGVKASVVLPTGVEVSTGVLNVVVISVEVV
jgi:hypothetical protein